MKKGLFVTLEGGEGVGKSTQIKLLKEALIEAGCEVVDTNDPGGTLIGLKIRTILKDNENKALMPKTELLLFLAARAQLVEEIIIPSLKKNKIVISDRYYHSTFAYQGWARGLSIIDIRQLNEFAIDGIKPDITFILDLPPQKGFDRMNIKVDKVKEISKNQIALQIHLPPELPRLSKDRIEEAGEKFHEKVQQAFLQLAAEEPERIVVLDAARPVEEIADEIKRKVLEKLKA